MKILQKCFRAMDKCAFCILSDGMLQACAPKKQGAGGAAFRFPEKNGQTRQQIREKTRGKHPVFGENRTNLKRLSKLTKNSLQTERTLFKHHDFLKNAGESKKNG